MTYATVERGIGSQKIKAKVVFEPVGWGLPYRDAGVPNLWDKTDVSGFEMFVLNSHDNYDNPFHKAMEALYKERGWYGIIARDVIREGGRGTDDKGRLNVNYVSHVGTDWENAHNIWMPKNGWYVPTDDGLFHEGTLVPLETVDTRQKAIERFTEAGLPEDMVSYSYRLDSYTNDPRLVGVVFDLGSGGGGRFGVRMGSSLRFLAMAGGFFPRL